MSKSYQQSSDRYKLAVGCNIFCIIKLQQLIRKQLIRGKLFYKLELNFVKLSRVNIGLDLILGRIVWFDLIWSYCESSYLHSKKKYQHFQIWYYFTQMVHFLLWIIITICAILLICSSLKFVCRQTNKQSNKQTDRYMDKDQSFCCEDIYETILTFV